MGRPVIPVVLLIILFWFDVHAVVEIYQRQQIPRPNRCLDFFEPHFDYLKSYRGIRRSLGGRDPVDVPIEHLSSENFAKQVFSGLETVHQAFEEAFRKMGWTEEQIKEQINKFKTEDALRLKQGYKNSESIYFISRGPEGDVGVMRAILVKEGEPGELSIESEITLPQGNRVELGRAYSAAGIGSKITLREMFQEAAQSFSTFFDKQEYQIYGLTNASRARNYRDWGFDDKKIESISNLHENYLSTQKGSDFNYRYNGHIERAIQLSFMSGPPRPALGLVLLIEMEGRRGMKDYIPNLVAQSALYGFMGKYDEALKISDHLMTIGSAEVNYDFNFLWQSRLKYKPFWKPEGNVDEALSLLRKPLEKKPLDTTTYNDRAALFIIYELKLLLSAERFEEASVLISKYRDFIHKVVEAKRAQLSNVWSYLGQFPGSSSGYVSHLENIRWAWDLNTNADGVSITALAPASYQMAADILSAMGDVKSSQHYSRVAKWLKIQLRDEKFPTVINRMQPY